MTAQTDERRSEARPPDDRIIREPECRQLTGLGRTRRYELERDGEFPLRVRLGERAHGWWRSDIVRWLESRPRGSG